MGTLSLSSAFQIFRSGGHVAVFYVALYLVALGEGAHKPCAQAFAADQFDEKDPKESVARSSFFNWWYFGMCAGTAVTTMVSSYVQDNVGWGLGFGIPCIVIAVSLVVFLIGTPSYRYYTNKEPSPVARVGKALLLLIKSWRSKHRTKYALIHRQLCSCMYNCASSDMTVRAARRAAKWRARTLMISSRR